MGEENRGRPSKISAEDIYDLLDWKGEPLSTTEIADELNVSSNTVRSKMDDIKEFRRVGMKPVAGSTVFWHKEFLASDDDVIEESFDLDALAEEYQQYAREKLVSARAVYLDKRDRLRHISRSAAANTETAVYHRLKLLSAVNEYEKTLASSGLLAYDQLQLARISDDLDASEIELEEVYKEDEYLLDLREFEYYALDVSLFGGELNGLTGLSGVYHHAIWSVNDSIEGGEFDYRAVLDDVPEFEEIIQAGDVLDDFVCAVYGVDW